MAQLDRIDGGSHTARVSAAVQDRIAREERQADALAYLTRTGQLDVVAEALGLVEPETETPEPKRRLGHKLVTR
ncbi:hypothetical protein OOJ91_13965 [Micromonospora lupini]|uniref:hypothetical protein n=1 Tax=Micromonospora lupini TaxID=285679 RepID=UPI0022542256|nr:hypothetical protein [Micromonospora lupini]MCX5066954.1 hypothetical protein [Micromonospora lupini]